MVLRCAKRPFNYQNESAVDDSEELSERRSAIDAWIHAKSRGHPLCVDRGCVMEKNDRAYDGFNLVPETDIDGWCYGAITVYGESCYTCPPGGCVSGDGFVEAPDGSRAGIVWSVGEFEPLRLSEPDDSRWGVFEVAFDRPVQTTEDLVVCFRKILPYLQKEYESPKDSALSSSPRRR